MYKGKKFLAIVPARGGSKGIPHKNIVNVDGRPLIAYTLDAAKKSKYIDAIYVSTDDEKIEKVSMQEEVEVIKRPDYLAADTSKTIDVLIHAVEEVGKGYDYLVLLQPTQPLRKARHIDEAIELMLEQKHESLISVSPVRNHPVLMRTMEMDGKLTPILNQSSTVRRQDFKEYYTVNGAIYINKIAELSKDTSLNDNQYGYLMDQEFDLDIDEPFDLYMFEKILERNK